MFYCYSEAANLFLYFTKCFARYNLTSMQLKKILHLKCWVYYSIRKRKKNKVIVQPDQLDL